MNKNQIVAKYICAIKKFVCKSKLIIKKLSKHKNSLYNRTEAIIYLTIVTIIEINLVNS